jgi:C1A family cysteine protease
MFLTLKEPDSTYSNNQLLNLTVVVPQKNIRIMQETNINWKAAKKMTSVKYQKECGACYSFTSIGAI